MATPRVQEQAPATDRIARLTSRIASSAGGTTTITAPFTGEPLAEVQTTAASDVHRAYERARVAQAAWAALPPRERAKPFLRLVDAAVDRRAEILDIVQLETGKARKHAFEEVLDVSLCSLYYARRASKLLKPRRRQGITPGLTRAYELRRPKGVVGLISPWNYPLSLGVTDIVPALIAGNAVVHKPDTQTCLSTLWAVDLLQELGLPEDLWQVVVGDPAEIGDAIIDGADYMAFTGSTRGGRAIAEKAASRLIGCSLELGGKNPMLVLEDADLDKAADGAVRACFTNAGQLCISIERLYVHANVHDEFVRRFVDRVGTMKLGADLTFDADMGSLTHQRQLETVTRHVEQAREKGATVLTGGKARPDLGPLFYEPTVLTGVSADMELCGGETFGPVVSVYPFTGDDEAVACANDTSYGLNASIWTRDMARGRRIAARIEAGTVNINEGYGAAYGSHDAPMGGMKQSGIGRRHGAEGMLKYTEPQTIASQHIMGLEPPGGMSFERYSALVAGWVKAAKRFRLR
ncbi:succinic semialdehyde dehydrogenase [Actinomadura sp. HBU206391]|uniref:succinic semialdehyde dehydrogenase n=1 Tax=Actinomadura sp. HBU206391 TaxID=2731692 RepID=UPI00164F6E52|nr:succinic semialdehyde dehydrogenase [Actinomadura sp. HBU206391]MBC6456969.1 succinate-semialdehyde dehydrogenase (NADP(+)) [Actinomadura sp. HBU206391]